MHTDNFKIKMLNWANQFNIFCLLENNKYNFQTPAFEFLLAVGVEKSFSFTEKNNACAFQNFIEANKDWLFGHLGYNAFGNAYSNNEQPEYFNNGFFFVPQTIIRYADGEIEIIKSAQTKQQILRDIENTNVNETPTSTNIFIKPQLDKAAYIHKINALKKHIQLGDCYEINFCKKFDVPAIKINPIDIYLQQTQTSPAPFGALYKLDNHYCICASPERFLQKKGTQLISQPIKGTSRRNANAALDKEALQALSQSQKEKSENVMVVDLVRNDLSIVCSKGSVQVKELYGLYSFPQVHQMISTVVGNLANDKNIVEAIEACYPMGSMTGAPKPKVMQLIEQYENFNRGLFSGSIGYITPESDFDFNVVIRSVFYDATLHKASFFAGSGITFYADAESEYDECMAKAEAMVSLLSTNK
jgi:para-aminobenzoate synthetase component I